MRRAQPDNDTIYFNEAMTFFKRAEKEIVHAQKEYEKGKDQVREQIDELLALIESIPEC